MRKYGLPGVFVAALMVLSLSGAAYAARGQKVPQSPCAFMLDIDKRAAFPEIGEVDCVLCRCILKGVEQDVFKIKISGEFGVDDGDCDDSGEQIQTAGFVTTRWLIAEKDDLAGTQTFCIRGKEDVELVLGNSSAGPVFRGKGVGVVGVGNPLKGELCCNFDESQATVHLTGIGHDSFGGPAPKKKCWARVKFISRLNPSDPTNPCSISGGPAQFVINGVEGCICDSSVDVPQLRAD